MQWYEKVAVLGRVASRRPYDLLSIIHDRQKGRYLRRTLPEQGSIHGDFSRVSIDAPNRTDLEQFEEIWVGQAYGLLDAFVPKSGWTVVDIGANIGCYTLWAARHSRRGKIYAFEPVPETFGYLQRNIEANKLGYSEVDIKLYSYAIADTDDTLSMLITAESTGWNRLISGDDLKRETRRVIQVPVKPLDALIPDESVDCLKVDVEGAELLVFQGASRTLQNSERVIMEYHSAELFTKCKTLLEKYGLELALRTSQPNLGMAYFQR